MDGAIGSFTIKPDQVQVINPLLILVFIPLYDVAFYPLLSKVGIRRPLQKLTLGGILAGVSFIISAILELELQKTYPVIPGSGETQLRVFNGNKCDYTVRVNINNETQFVLKSMEYFEEKYISVEKNGSIPFDATPTGTCAEIKGDFSLIPGEAIGNLFRGSDSFEFIDNPSKSRNGYPLFRVLSNTGNGKSNITFLDTDDGNFQRYTNHTEWYSLNEIPPSNYDVFVDNQKAGNIELKLGGVYTVILQEENPNVFKLNLHTITEPNSIHMSWIIPQYVVMTLGEVMYSVTGLEFSYSQAPGNMKSVLQAGWQLTIAVGNVVVAIVAEAKIFSSQANEFFLFAGLMFVDMLLFSILAWRYVYVDPKDVEAFADDVDDEVKDSKKNSVALVEKTGINNAGFKTD